MRADAAPRSGCIMGGPGASSRIRRMRRALLLGLLAAALVAGPAARLAAAAPCSGTAAMDCCSGMGDDDGAPPCHCSLKPVVPAPAALDAAHAPAAVLAAAPLRAVEAEAPAEARASAPVAPRARAAPLFLLFAVLLV